MIFGALPIVYIGRQDAVISELGFRMQRAIFVIRTNGIYFASRRSVVCLCIKRIIQCPKQTDTITWCKYQTAKSVLKTTNCCGSIRILGKRSPVRTAQRRAALTRKTRSTNATGDILNNFTIPQCIQVTKPPVPSIRDTIVYGNQLNAIDSDKCSSMCKEGIVDGIAPFKNNVQGTLNGSMI
jgi:hypothetical protein